MIDFSISPIYGSVVFVLIVIAVLLLGVWFFRERTTLTFRQRATLFSLRAACLLLILAMMIRPGVTFRSTTSPQGAIAVLLDRSRSMDLSSQDSGRTRFDVATSAFAKLQAAEGRLGKENPIVPFVYDTALLKVDSADVTDSTIEPFGDATDVGKTLSDVLSQQVDPPLSAVIWMGDGIQTTLPASVDAQQTAAQLARLDIPLLLVGIGPSGGSENFKDLAIGSVPEQLDVFTKNRITISGQMRSQGVINRDLDAQLLLVDDDGNEQLLGVDKLRPDQLDQILPFQISITAPEPGAYELIARLPTIDGEVNDDNNESILFLNVAEGGSRILYLDGEPREEQQFIRRGLAESPDLQLDFRWIQRGAYSSGPLDLSDVMAADVYDAYVLGDLDARALTTDTWQELVNRVGEGAGLITLGGFHAYGAGAFDRSPVSLALPVETRIGRPQQFGQPINLGLHYTGAIQVEPITRHPITNFGSAEQTAERWKSVEPIRGANRWAGIKNEPGVQVLAEGRDSEPLIVVGSYGAGRVLSVAFDTSFRWWRSGDSEFHRQFWRQAMLWCMRNEKREESLQLEMDKRRLFRGQKSSIQLTFIRGSQTEGAPNGLKLELFFDGELVRAVPVAKEGNDVWSVELDCPTKPGRYELVASAKGTQDKPLDAMLPFIVSEQSVEMMQPIPDWQLMQQMAQLNEIAGGRLFGPEEIDELIRVLLERKKSAQLETLETLRVGDTTADSWVLFLSFVAVMSMLWYARKKFNLA
jgi:uncharacterized membrane protein